jgi:hypothetical protein
MIKIRTLLLVFVLCFLWAADLCAKEVVVLYTGNTHAMLYTCSCPIERDGGVARRATLIKKERKRYPGLLLLDCGAFTAGGLLDEYTQNTSLDMRRSELNLEAMRMMGYDAVAVSSDEFNFGKDFFLNNAGKEDPVFLSLNLESDKVKPYMVKEVSGVRIALIGLTSLAARQKSEGLKVSPPKFVDQLVKRLKSEGADVVIALSTMGTRDDLELISEAEGIDILFMGYNAGKEDVESKVGSTFIVRPSWQGRKLGRLILDVKDGRLVGCKDEQMRLSDKVADDPEIAKILPRCFSDLNCREDGLKGTCKDPGAPGAECLFDKPGELKLTVITARDCVVCDTQPVLDTLKKQFPGARAEYVDVKQADKLIRDLSIKALPAYVIGREVEKEKNFNSFKGNLEPIGGMYLLKPEVSGISYLLNRKPEKGRLDLFVSLFDKDAFGILSVLKEFKPKVHFLAVKKDGGFDAKGGRPEIEECLRGVCVQKYYPDKFWNYLSCRAKDIDSSWWDDCLTQEEAFKVKSCARGQEGTALLGENIALNQELQVGLNLSYLLDNYQIFSSRGVPNREELKKVIKR